MATSKVILNGTVAMDVTQTTVQSNNLESGATALDNKGNLITGSTAVGKIANLDWTKIKQCVNNGVDPSFLPIGTQIQDKWTWQGVTYDAPWNVVHYNSQGMYLQWEYAWPEDIQFDAPEAIYYVNEEGLPAGTYYFSILYDYSNNWNTSKHIQFTLSQACDPGDQFELTVATSQDPTAGRSLVVYGKGSTIAKQSTTTSNGTDGVELGIIGNSSDIFYYKNGQCNGIFYIQNGDHRWSQSAIRQWLNSDAAAGEWWEPQNPWDRPPSYAANRPGFLSGFSEAFKNMLETTTVTTLLNTTSGFTDVYEMTQDKIFMPSLEQLYTVSNVINVEGEPWDYWKKRAKDAGIIGYMNYDKTADNNIRKQYRLDNKTSSAIMWLRSPWRINNGVCYINAAGGIGNTNPRTIHKGCPACVVKKSTPTYLDRLNDINWATIKKMTGTDLEVGSQIIDSWTASNNGAVWNVPWDIVHYDDTSMYLHWHYNLPFNTAFDAGEAMYYVGESGLAAGTYYITTGSDTGKSNWNSKNIQFTLTQVCDPGDQFVIASPSSDPTASRTLTVYGFGGTTAKQTATTSSGTDGILLGTMGNKGITNGNCNGVYQVTSGNHRWGQSNLRTWLNSNSPAGQWFTPMNPWDRPPDYVNYPGFLYGFSSDFKNALAFSENKTLLDTVSGFTDICEITQDKIFLPGKEQINYDPDAYDVEGEPWQYYQDLAKDAGITGYFTAGNIALRKFNLESTTTPYQYWIRTPRRDNDYERIISTSGSTSTTAPSNSSYRACPCCKINLVK